MYIYHPDYRSNYYIHVTVNIPIIDSYRKWRYTFAVINSITQSLDASKKRISYVRAARSRSIRRGIALFLRYFSPFRCVIKRPNGFDFKSIPRVKGFPAIFTRAAPFLSLIRWYRGANATDWRANALARFADMPFR